MTTRSEREKAQKLNEQHQAILSKMLREEDNKYCADCEAKGATFKMSSSCYILTHKTSIYISGHALKTIVASVSLHKATARYGSGSDSQLTPRPLKLN